MNGLTQKQLVVVSNILVHKGSPTVRELCERLPHMSESAIRGHLKALADKGVVMFWRTKPARIYAESFGPLASTGYSGRT